MLKANNFIIGTLPYAFLIGFMFASSFGLSYYYSLGSVCFLLFVFNVFFLSSFKVAKYSFYLLSFGLYVIFSNIFIANNNVTFYSEVVKNPYLHAFFIINIIENTRFEKKTINSWFIVFKVTIWISLIVIFIQQFYETNFLVYESGVLNFDQSNVSHSEVRLASIYSFTSTSDLIFYFVPISFFVIQNELFRGKYSWAFIYLSVLITVVVLSKARTGMIAALPVLLIVRTHFTRMSKYSFLTSYSFLFAIVAVIFISFTYVKFFNQVLEDRILESSKGDIENRSLYTRYLALEAFAKFYPEKPFLGVGNTKYSIGGTGKWERGLDNFLGKRSSQIHIGILSLFYLYGFFGALLYLIFYFKAAKKMYHIANRYHFQAVFWSFMVLPLANLGMVSFNLLGSGLLLAFVFMRNISQIRKINDVTSL